MHPYPVLVHHTTPKPQLSCTIYCCTLQLRTLMGTARFLLLLPHILAEYLPDSPRQGVAMWRM